MPGQKKYSALVLSHWYSIIDGVHFSTEEFYQAIEEGIRERKLPGLSISRVAFLEGSIVSDKRLYLRLSREQFAFDLCAAPFGRAYFFSLRLVERGKSWFKLILFLLGVGVALRIIAANTADSGQTVAWVLVCALGLFVLGAIIRRITSEATGGGSSGGNGNALSGMSWGDLISGTAVIGSWYDRVRRDTYFRYDTRLLYHQLVSEIVKKAVEEMTAAKGVELRREWDCSPAFDDLYRMKTVEREAVGVS